MNIVILDSEAVNPGDLSWNCLIQFGNLTVHPRTTPEETISRIGNHEIVITNKVPLDAQILRACPSIRLICCLSTGYNVVDIRTAKQLGIPVCNVPAYSTEAVAQFTIALLLELCHRIGHHDQVVHDGKWADCPNFCFWDTPQMCLSGKTLGIIGYGQIGRAVARIAQALGMHVICHSRTCRGDGPYVDLDTLLSQSDVITLHCPLFPETANLISTDSIARMKDGAILLNTSRGQVIDETAVAHALSTGKLSGAAMDVVSVEPISPTNPLLTAPNCIITPHIAWAPAQMRQRIIDTTCNSIRAFLSGSPINVVNP